MRRIKFPGILKDKLITWRPDQMLFTKKLSSIGFHSVVPVNYRVKIKENERRDKYLEFIGKLKVPWNMRVMGMTIVIDTLGTFPKGLENGQKEL